ncbi:MAG: hypothetical protein ACXVP7_08980 [Actinomycetota bacterium]
MVTRRRALAAGLVAVAAYAALAGLSGRLSPLARGPLLDGIGPAQPYRWVNPPATLASGNRPPASGDFLIPLDANGSRPEVFVTSDNQVTIVVPKGAFDLKAGQIQVKLSVQPVDPATLTEPNGVTIFGNAVGLQAVYEPSGKPAALASPLDLILLYPSTASLHASKHQLYTSTDGKAWTEQDGSDSLAQQQAEGPMTALGYVLVAGKAGPPVTPPASGSSGGSTAIVLIVVAVCIGLIGLGLVVRGRGAS